MGAQGERVGETGHVKSEFTPTYQIVKISTDVIAHGSIALINVIGVVVWFAIFIALATFAVRSTAETV